MTGELLHFALDVLADSNDDELRVWALTVLGFDRGPNASLVFCNEETTSKSTAHSGWCLWSMTNSFSAPLIVSSSTCGLFGPSWCSFSSTGKQQLWKSYSYG